MSCGKRLAAELRRLGFRVTPQRAVILETVAHMQGHSSAQTVYAQARSQLPGLNLATVYRTLETLNEAGLIDLLSTSTDSMRFSMHDDQNPHYHLVCSHCGSVQDVPPEKFQSLADAMKECYGFQLDVQNFTLSGLCAACTALSDSEQDG